MPKSLAAPARRAPTFVSLGVAALLMFTAVFERGGTERAASFVVGHRSDAALDVDTIGLVKDLHALGVIVLAITAVASVVVVLLGVRLTRSLRDEDRSRERTAHEERLAALGQMSAVLAHELRNPLASLKGNAQLLAEVLPAEDRHRAKADRVVGEAIRLERLMNELLEFVRTGELRRARANVEEIVRAAVRAVSVAGAEPIAVEVAEGLGECVLDAGRLQMAIENVVRNAVDSSPTGEAVTVSVARENDLIVVTVRDRGAGIAPGDEDAIFRPFFTRKNHGTGLGLPVTRRIMELHGGRIVASNHPEGGAVFRMTLPSER